MSEEIDTNTKKERKTKSSQVKQSTQEQAPVTWTQWIASFDFYKHLPKDLAEPSMTGATFSFVSVGLLIVLFVYEVVDFISISKQSELIIDVSLEEQFIDLNLNITLPRAPCHILSLDIVDVTGVHEVNLAGQLYKHVLDIDGNKIDALDALQKRGVKDSDAVVIERTIQSIKNGEGCQIEGTVQLHKVPGNFHLSSHDYQAPIQRVYGEGYKIDLSHIINHLSFGDPAEAHQIEKKYSDTINNELSGTKVMQEEEIHVGQMLVNYFLDITELEYRDTTTPDNKVYSGFKYRTQKQISAQSGMPTLFFRYEIAPIKVVYDVKHQSWSDFLVHLCAIIGGVFACSGILAATANSIAKSIMPEDDVSMSNKN